MSFGDFLTDVVAVGAGYLIGGPIGGALAGGLIGGARDGKEGVMKGAALGALGAIVGAGFSEAGLFGDSATAADLGTEAATAETLTAAGDAGAVVPEVAATDLAQATLAGAEASPGVAPGGAMDMTGSVASPTGAGAGGTVFDGSTPTGKGFIQSGLDFANKNKLVTVMGLQAVGGIGKSVADRQTMKEKMRLDRENAIALEEERVRRIQAGSAGGRGVNLNIRPGDTVLRRPDGTPVFQGGLINSRMR